MLIEDTRRRRSVSKSTLCNIDWSAARWIFEFEKRIDHSNEKRRYLYAHCAPCTCTRVRYAIDVIAIQAVCRYLMPLRKEPVEGAQFCMLIRRGMRVLESLDHTRRRNLILIDQVCVSIFSGWLSDICTFASTVIHTLNTFSI